MRQPCLRERDEEGHGQVRDGLLVHHPHRARQDHVHHAHARVARGQAHIAPRHFLFGFSTLPPPARTFLFVDRGDERRAL